MLVFFEGEPGFRSGNQTSLEFGLMSLTLATRARSQGLCICS